MQAVQPTYIRTWRRRRLVGLASIGSMVAGAMLPGLTGLGVFAVGFAGFGNWYLLFPCPRCGLALGHNNARLFFNPFRACAHCELPLGAKSDPGQKAPEGGAPTSKALRGRSHRGRLTRQ